MKVAGDAIILKVVTGRENLDAESVLIVAIDLAEIGRLAVAQQRLQGLAIFVAIDVDVEVTATGSTLAIVGGAARGSDTRIGRTDHRQVRTCGSRHGYPSTDQPFVFHQPEAITAESTRLGDTFGLRDLARKSMCLATDGGVLVHLQMTTGYMNPGLHPELVVIGAQVTKIDPLGVAEHPGCVVILGSFEGRHPEGDIEGVAVTTEGTARWRGHRIRYMVTSVRAP